MILPFTTDHAGTKKKRIMKHLIFVLGLPPLPQCHLLHCYFSFSLGILHKVIVITITPTFNWEFHKSLHAFLLPYRDMYIVLASWQPVLKELLYPWKCYKTDRSWFWYIVLNLHFFNFLQIAHSFYMENIGGRRTGIFLCQKIIFNCKLNIWKVIWTTMYIHNDVSFLFFLIASYDVRFL